MWQAFAVFDFVWNYALPVTIFAYCYARIFYIIRRHNKIASGHVGGTQDIAMTTLPRGQNDGEVQQQEETEAATGSKLSHRELNVLQTIVIIIICYIVCWAPTSFANVVQSITVCAFLHIKIIFISLPLYLLQRHSYKWASPPYGRNARLHQYTLTVLVVTLTAFQQCPLIWWAFVASFIEVPSPSTDISRQAR